MKYIAHFSSGPLHLEVREIEGNKDQWLVPCPLLMEGSAAPEDPALYDLRVLRYNRIAWWIPRGAPDEMHIMFRHDGRECR